MHPLKIQISGRYWDSYLYAGRLYLFDRDGGVRTIDWDGLVDSIAGDLPESGPIKTAFKRSDLLYRRARELKRPQSLRRRLLSLEGKSFSLSAGSLDAFTLSHTDSPFAFPHTDLTAYMFNLFAVGSSGVFHSSLTETGSQRVPSRASKLWDAPAMSLAAGYGALALAVGEDGVFEVDIWGLRRSGDVHLKPRQIAKAHASQCNWTYYSIYASSHLGGGLLADFELQRQSQPPPETTGPRLPFTRQPREVLPDEEIFHSAGYSWGQHDKLCQIGDGRLAIVRYSPWRGPEDRLQEVGSIAFDGRPSAVVAGATAAFGSVVEFERSLLVAATDGAAITLRGEPVNWRVFPKSKHYENHLHVVRPDRLDVNSFNHDFFLNQAEKLTGIRYTQRRPVFESPKRRRSSTQ